MTDQQKQELRRLLRVDDMWLYANLMDKDVRWECYEYRVGGQYLHQLDDAELRMFLEFVLYAEEQ